MINLKKHLKTAWDKVRDLLNNEDHRRSLFYLSNDEADQLREEYSLFQQHTFIINKYGGLGCTSIPTSHYKISNPDLSPLNELQITAIEEKLKALRNPNNDTSHNPSLKV